MKTPELAQALLNRRNRMNPVVMPGELHAEVGAEGMQEALQRRWLVPSFDSGHLMVSTDMAVVEEMRAEADKKDDKKKEDEKDHKCSCGHADESSRISLAHAHRNINELLAPGTGHDNSAPFRPKTPNTPTSTMPNKASPDVGDDVIVAEAGKTYTGKVGAKNQDGKYTVSFGNEKPPVNRSYGPNELKVVGGAGAANV
jgi:hypothetical protein